MYNHVEIIINEENKTLTLTLPHNSPEGDIVGPYTAMMFHLYENYQWVNYKEWCGDKIDITTLRNRTSKVSWEYYQNNTIIVDEEYSMEENIGQLITELGYLPNYILQIEEGQVDLLTIENLEKEFGEGEYYYDANNIPDAEPDKTFKGEYLRCIGDLAYNTKSGEIDSSLQEIFIPFPQNSKK